MAKFKVRMRSVAIVECDVDIEMPDDVIDDWTGDERLRVVASHAEDLVCANDWPADWKLVPYGVDLDAVKVEPAREVK